MENFVYKFVPFIPRLKVGVFGTQNAESISSQLGALVAGHIAQGWEYVRLEQVSVSHAAGCLASLFGRSDYTAAYDLVVFRAPASVAAARPDESARATVNRPAPPPPEASRAKTTASGVVKGNDGVTRTITEIDIPASLKSVYTDWENSPEDVAAWSRFLKVFERNASRLPHGQGAVAAVGSFFPAALDRAEFAKLIEQLES